MGTATFADRDTFLKIVQYVTRLASANAWCDALAVSATTGTDWPTFAIHFVIAQFTRANIRRKTVSIFLTWLLTNRHADSIFRKPAGFASALIWPSAFAPETALLAMKIAITVRNVTLVTLAAVQNRYESMTMSIVLIVLWQRDRIVRHSASRIISQCMIVWDCFVAKHAIVVPTVLIGARWITRTMASFDTLDCPGTSNY